MSLESIFGFGPESYVNDTDMCPNNELFKGFKVLAHNAAGAGRGVHLLKSPSQVESRGIDLGKLKLEGVEIKEHIFKFTEMESMKEAVYWYMLASSACYVEIPRNRYIGGNAVESYDKYLCTSSIDVVAQWLGVTRDESLETLKGKLNGVGDPTNLSEGVIPWVKLNVNAKGERSIVRSRNKLDLATKGMRVMPWVVLSEYVKVLVEKAQDGYIGVKYLKDNGTVRYVVTTFNIDILRDVYGQQHTIDILSLCESSDEDDINWSKRTRGYISVPEVGLPKDDRGVRSINFNRIIDISFGVEPDLTFVDVDLAKVVSEFNNLIEGFTNSKVEYLVEGLISEGVLKEDGGKWKTEPSAYTLTGHIDVMEKILGTGFQKDLYNFIFSDMGKMLLGVDEGFRGKFAISSSPARVDNFTMGIATTETGSSGSDDILDISLEW